MRSLWKSTGRSRKPHTESTDSLARKSTRALIPFSTQHERLKGMTEVENEPQEAVSNNLNRDMRPSTDLDSRRSLAQRLRRGRQVRARFVESNISKALAFQIRSFREREGWSQQFLAEKIDSNQNAVYRAENPNYGKQTVTTLKKIAAAFDVALVVRFVPFSELVDWVSGVPRVIDGLGTASLAPPSFETEDKACVFDVGPLINNGVKQRKRTLGVVPQPNKQIRARGNVGASPSLAAASNVTTDQSQLEGLQNRGNLYIMESPTLTRQPSPLLAGCAGGSR